MEVSSQLNWTSMTSRLCALTVNSGSALFCCTSFMKGYNTRFGTIILKKLSHHKTITLNRSIRQSKRKLFIPPSSHLHLLPTPTSYPPPPPSSHTPSLPLLTHPSTGVTSHLIQQPFPFTTAPPFTTALPLHNRPSPSQQPLPSQQLLPSQLAPPLHNSPSH